MNDPLRVIELYLSQLIQSLSYVLPEPYDSVHRGPRLNLMPSKKKDMKREKFTVCIEIFFFHIFLS